MTAENIITQYPYYEKIGNTELVQLSKQGKAFLEKLFNQNSRTLYARVRAKELSNSSAGWSEDILIGQVSDGSINVDGNSTARRTCNLTFVSQDTSTLKESNWALENKFFLELGIEASFDWDWKAATPVKAGDIVWFPQGEFYITSFNSSLAVNSFRISISGQDKMAKLNGTIGGVFTSQMSLSQYDQLNEEGEVESTQELDLLTIIKNLVVNYGEEQESNIIITDLSSETAANLLEYQGTSPMYLLLGSTNNDLIDGKRRKVVAITTYGKQGCYVSSTSTTLGALGNYYVSEDAKGQKITLVSGSGAKEYYCQRVEYGQTVGYEPTKLIYPGELVGEIGTTVTAALDKIKSIYTNYEYYYDVFGRFIFKKKSSYCETTYPESKDGSLEIKLKNLPDAVWTFKDLKFQTSLNNTPAIGELKNDFSVWGRKKTTSGEMPVHMRVAIQDKPTAYTPVYKINTSSGAVEKNNGTIIYKKSDKCDWRELIYQMALDENRAKKEAGKSWSLASWRQEVKTANGDLYPGGVTGYEDFYLDMLTFWRDLYDPNRPMEYIATTPDNTEQANKYLAYCDSTTTDYTLDINNYYVDWSSSVGGTPVRVKWIDQYDILTQGYSNKDIYAWYQTQETNGIVNLEEQIDLSKSAVYYYDTAKQTWKRPYELMIEKNTGNTKYKNIYYANTANLESKQTLITSGDIQYLEDINNINYYNNKLYFIRVSETTSSESEISTANGSTITKDNFISVIKSLQSDIKGKKDIELTLADKTEVEYDSTTDIIAVKYYRKALTNSDIEFYITLESGKEKITYLVDELTDKRRRNFCFRTNEKTTVEDTSASKNSTTITNTATTQTITTIDSAKKQKTTTVYTFSPTLNSLVFDKTALYTTDADQNYTFFDYAAALKRETKTIYYRSYCDVTKTYTSSEKNTNCMTKLASTATALTETIPVFDYYGTKIGESKVPIICYYEHYPYGEDYWNSIYIKEPYKKLFWLEFIEPKDNKWYSTYDKATIGKRQKAINDMNTTALDYALTPNIQFGTADQPLPEAYKKYFIISRQGKSAREAIDELLFKHTYAIESTVTQILPLYFLEPNQIIKIEDINGANKTGINDYYSINSYSLPLNYSATMSLNLTKIFQYDGEKNA